MSFLSLHMHAPLSVYSQNIPTKYITHMHIQTHMYTHTLGGRERETEIERNRDRGKQRDGERQTQRRQR